MIITYLLIAFISYYLMDNKDNNDNKTNIPPIYIAHGGGPMPLLNDPGHKELVDSLKQLTTLYQKPKAILVVSAHWEEKDVTILENPNSELLFDYYGFPKETYKYSYKAPFAKDVNERLVKLFEENKIPFKKETNRGYDHGVFIPLLIMYPNADIPITQISLKSNLNPEEHIKIGEALSSLSNLGVLILGSGLSFHNMGAFQQGTMDKSSNENFNNYLKDIFQNSNHSVENRVDLLKNWSKATGAKFCHPREEHLIPLMVISGAAKNEKATVFEMKFFSQFLVLNIMFDKLFYARTRACC